MQFKMLAKKYETYTRLKLLGVGSFGRAYLVERSSDKAILSVLTFAVD